jgi:hypothetical protein
MSRNLRIRADNSRGYFRVNFSHLSDSMRIWIFLVLVWSLMIVCSHAVKLLNSLWQSPNVPENTVEINPSCLMRLIQ